MEFTNDLKGTLAQAAMLCALRHAGYPVVPLGIESLFPMLPLLSGATYADLALGPEVRLLPDLLLLPLSGPGRLVEVKYRTVLDREVLQKLLAKVTDQQRSFPDTYTIVIRSVSPSGAGACFDDLVRVLPPRRLELLAGADVFFHTLPAADNATDMVRLEPLWQALRPLTSVFDRLQGERRVLLDHLVPLFTRLTAL